MASVISNGQRPNALMHSIGSGMGTPILIVVMMAMVILPLPAFLLDVLFTFNISLALVVLLAGIYSRRPLAFASFPTILLIATLLRLALNVASTRVVLLNGRDGTDAAGQVIEAFGEFVVGGNYTVGFVVFAILVIINFVVVTKGAGRISEVSARFTLDAMPGKQMAIDADLNAGLIDQETARTRREDVAQEADFYGSMDGASKFVRGDAIAGILILFINIIGGLAIGSMQYDMPLSEAARVFTLLTIGDGLVAQIPSLFLSTAAAIMVTRVSTEHDVGEQVVSQLFEDPKALAITALVLGTLGVIPGMPNIAFLVLASAAGYGAYWQAKRASAAPTEEQELEPEPPPADTSELTWDDVSPLDILGLEVGYRLIPLVDRNKNGQLLARLRGVRKKLSQELGFLIPAVHIRDNLDLDASSYQITVLGSVVGQGTIEMNKELAINPGQIFGTLDGQTIRDPVFDLEAVWIDESQSEQAHTLGYTVVDTSTVVATHVSQIIQEYAHELFGHDEAQKLLDALSESSPKLVEDLVPSVLPLTTVVKVMQNLLAEKVSVRDLRTILEVLSEHGLNSQNSDVLTAATRVALGRSIVQQINGLSDELPIMTLDPSLEQLLLQSVESANGSSVPLEPGLANSLMQSIKEAHTKQQASGEPSVLLVNDPIRPLIVKLTATGLEGLHVLAYGEVPGSTQLRIVHSIGDASLTHAPT